MLRILRSNSRSAQGLPPFDFIGDRLAHSGDESLSIGGMGEEFLGDELRGVQFRIRAREFRTLRRPRFGIDARVPDNLSDLGALLQEILSFHGPAVQMGLNLGSFDDPALLVADGANHGHGFRAQLPHHHLVARLRPRERLPDRSFEILTPEGALPVRGIDLHEVGKIRMTVVPVVRGAMIQESAGVDAIGGLGLSSRLGANRIFGCRGPPHGPV